MNMKKAAALAALTTAASSSFAAGGPDFAAMTGAIDLTTVIAAILAVGLIAVNFSVAKGGAIAILGFIRSAVK